MSERTARIARATKETDIDLSVGLDGTGKTDVETGIGFFDHMLTAFGRHGLFDLQVRCKGDLEVDGHHSVEDTGIVMGQAFAQALGDKRGIRRFGDILREASAGLCFVGRNGGTKFLALFENCDENSIPAFLDRVRAGVERYNARAGEKIEYRWGEAFREGPEIATIHRLIALSDRRLRENADHRGGEYVPSGR